MCMMKNAFKFNKDVAIKVLALVGGLFMATILIKALFVIGAVLLVAVYFGFVAAVLAVMIYGTVWLIKAIDKSSKAFHDYKNVKKVEADKTQQTDSITSKVETKDDNILGDLVDVDNSDLSTKPLYHKDATDSDDLLK